MQLSLTEDGALRIDNQRYIKAMLKVEGLTDCNPTKNPLTKRALRKLTDGRQVELNEADAAKYRTQLSKIHWLASTTHPQLAVAHSTLAKYQDKPFRNIDSSYSVLDLSKSCMRYIAGTQNTCLEKLPGVETGFTFYSDADSAGSYATDGETRSRTGYVAFFNDMPVDWHSKLQTSIATATAESESRAIATGAQRALKLLYIAQELGITDDTKVRLFTDASAAMGFGTNNSGSTTMKHIDIREGWVQELRDRKKLELMKIHTRLNAECWW